MKLKKISFFTIIFTITWLCFSINGCAQIDSMNTINADNFPYKDSPFYKDSLQIQWVEKTYNNMTLDEKIGQLFIVAAYSNRDSVHENDIRKLIKNEKIGGLIFMQDDAKHQVELTNEFQTLSKIPLLIGIDGEWGMAMRLKNVKRFPWNITLGALKNNDLVYQTGKNIALQAKRLGVNFNFAPVVDVNINPDNPIIGNRSFGSDVKNVSEKGISYMKGLQDENVISSAKHFPGHGDTDKDSHKTLPSVNHDLNTLNQIDLKPFEALIKNKVGAVMVAHLSVPSLEPDAKLPSSLSYRIVTDLLKNKMGFKGLIVTDALNMAGVANAFPNGQTDYLAFKAGNDLLLFSQAVKVGKQKILDGLQNGSIKEERLEESVKKILMAKYFAGLNNIKPIDPNHVLEDLNAPANDALTAKIFEQAITLVKNDPQTLPIQEIKGKKIALVILPEEKNYQTFYKTLQKYTNVDLITVSNSQQVNNVAGYDYVISAAFLSNETVYKSYKLSETSKNILKSLNGTGKNIFVLFGSPYGLKDLDVDGTNATLVAYQNTEEAQLAVPQVIFGAIPVLGILPVDVNSEIKAGKSIETKSIKRLGFTSPENVGLDSIKLKKIDEIAFEAITSGVTPGMQVLAAKDGKIIFDKSFGFLESTHDSNVKWDDIYDLASVTKITATLPLLMQEVGKGNININQTIGDLLPETNSSNKGKLKVSEVLSHQAGLTPWLGFYKESVNVQNARLYLDYYARKQDEEHPYKVAKDIFIIKSIKDTILSDINHSPLGAKKYEYSDLGYYYFQAYLEKKYGKSLNELTQENFYETLGMNHTTFNPLEKFSPDHIAPTENDKTYRNQLLRGYVHDQGAAMMGGVAGHAGLFSNADDLAKLIQMYLNGGTYGGIEYIKPEVLAEFAQQHFNHNRRGLGFDMMSNAKSCKCPSDLSYGHTGFTGTMVWIDPKYQIIYIFLSNRVNPSVNNNKLRDNNIREKIRQVFYDALL